MMAIFDAAKFAQYIRQHQNPLVVVGDGCDRIRLDGKLLVDYATEIALKLGCPVAATGNTVLAVKKDKRIKTKKMWLAELFRYLQEKWAEPLVAQRPDILVLIGYRPETIDGMNSGLKRIHTVHLGPGKALSADKSMEALPFSQWKKNLDELIRAL
jgi:CO dehydrogenase/acetyl-CoA synthase epsilon subunit